MAGALAGPGRLPAQEAFPRKVDAERFLSALAADLHRGTYLDPAAGEVTVGQWAEQWADGLSHLKETTRERYRGICRVHVVPKWGRRALGSVTHAEVGAWVTELSATGLAPGSVRQIHRVFALLLDLAVRDGRIAKNPATGVRLPRPRRGDPVFLSGEQVVRLADAAGDYRLVVLVLALTGLRFGELTALRVRRVDLARRRLTVAESATEVGGRLVWSTPKTHQTRAVPLPRPIVDALAAACADKDPDALVFTSPEGEALRLGNWRRRVFDPACAAVGIKGVSPHDLRHTAASLAVSAGANVKAVQRMLGHASAAMTLDIYAGLFGDDLDAVADRLEALAPHLCHTGADEVPAGPVLRLL